MSTDIQQARDVLAKWREDTINDAPQPWTIVTDKYGQTDVSDAQSYPLRSNGAYAEEDGDMHPSVARLIVGTAGNPELWDAIDGMLAQVEAIRHVCPAVLIAYAERIAAEIIAADERMNA